MIPARGSRRGGLRDVVAHSTITTTKASALEPPRRRTFVCVYPCVYLYSLVSLALVPPPACTHTHTHSPSSSSPSVFSRSSSLLSSLGAASSSAIAEPQPADRPDHRGDSPPAPFPWDPGGASGPGGALKTRNLLSIWERKKKRKRNSNADRGLGDPPQQAISTLSWRNVRECVQNRVAGGRGVQAKTRPVKRTQRRRRLRSQGYK